MTEAKVPGVQRLARKRHRLGAGPAGAAGVDRVADHRMAALGEVHANLMGSPGQEAALDQRGRLTKNALDLVAGHRRLAARRADHRHLLPVGHAAPDIACDLARGRQRHAPQTIAAYAREMRRAAKSRDSARCAISVLATTIRPLVSLSSRWTIPGRRTPPIPARLAPQWAMSALTSVPSGLPGAGWTTSPAGLSMTMRCASSKRISRGIAWACGVASSGSGTITTKVCPDFTLRAGSRITFALSDAPSLTCPERISCLRRERDSSGRCRCRARSSRSPVAAASTVTKLDVMARRPPARRRNLPPQGAGPVGDYRAACGGSQ